jgi:hypothetical protein
VAILVEGCQFHDTRRFMNRQEIESYCDWFSVVGDVRSGLFKKREEFHDAVARGGDPTWLRSNEREIAVLDVYLRVNGETEYLPLGAGKTRPASEHLDPWRSDAQRWLTSNKPGMAAFGHRFADHFESDTTTGARRARDDRTSLCLVSADEFSNDPEYGMVMRVEGQRRQLESYPEGSRQPRGGLFEFDQRFGLWLCKDFIPIVQRNDILTQALARATEKAKKRLRFDLSKTRFWQIFINHQDFLLTANRNDIANATQHASKIVELVATRIAETLTEEAFREWIENLQRAVTASKRSRELAAITDRVESVTAWFKKPRKDDIEPTALALERLEEEDSLRLPAPKNEQELFCLYAVVSGMFRMPLRVIEYDTRLGIDAIAQVVDGKMFPTKVAYARVEFKFMVRANVAIGHFFDAIDALICWSVAGTGPLPEAGDGPVTGMLRKRKAPRLASKLDAYEVEYTDDKGVVRILPVLVLGRLFG